MIQLYKSTNTNYSMNGDYTLSPLSCEFECELNGAWVLNLESPIDKSMNDFIIGAVISAPTPYGKQLFRIYDVTKDDDGIIASAFPIFLDAKNDCFLWDVRPSNVTGKTALNQMITNKKYSASSNITKTSTAYYVQKNLIEALNGDDDNAFLKRWGGEIAYNNYEIIVNDRIGSDNGLHVEFGFNLLGVEEQINNESIVTRIIPKAYNGYILPNNETVDSPLINNYPIVYTRVIEYQDIKLIDDAQEDDAENGITVCNTLEELYDALRTRANKEFENGIDLPQITYNVDMVDLSKTDLYKDYKNLLTVNLGDTVHVKHRKLGIETSARVISMTYDCITKKVESLVLGDYEANYFNDVSSITHSASQVINTSNNTLMADKIAGIINLLNTSLRAQKDIAQKQDVRAILFEDLDESSPTFGALCIGTQGIQIAKQRNATDTDWQWGTAIDFQSINADYVITGILTDRQGNFYLDMSNGDLRMKNGTFVGNITGGSIKIGSNFSVDSNGNLVAKNASFQGSISGSTITGGTISGTTINGGTINGGTIAIGNNFKVDSSGNLTAKGNASFQGSISGSTITGGTITGTTITTDKDLRVGNNIYLTQAGTGGAKGIYLNGNNYIAFNGSSQLLLSSNTTIAIQSGSSNAKSSGVYASNNRLILQWSEINKQNVSIAVQEGHIYASRQIEIYSDMRLKENIKEIDLTGIFEYLNIYEFNYIGSDKRTVGVIAQDFVGTPYEDIILSKNEKGYYSVDYNVINMAIAQFIKKVMKC